LLLAERSVRNFCNKQLSKIKFITQIKYNYSAARQMLFYFYRPKHFLPHSFQLINAFLPFDFTHCMSHGYKPMSCCVLLYSNVSIIMHNWDPITITGIQF
jgi:hypothetical protein